MGKGFDQRLGNVLIRCNGDPQASMFGRFARSGYDRRYLSCRNSRQLRRERFNSIDAGEQNPVITVACQRRLAKRLGIGRRCNANDRQHDHFRSQPSQRTCKLFGLAGSTRYDNTQSERAPFARSSSPRRLPKVPASSNDPSPLTRTHPEASDAKTPAMTCSRLPCT